MAQCVLTTRRIPQARDVHRSLSRPVVSPWADFVHVRRRQPLSALRRSCPERGVATRNQSSIGLRSTRDSTRRATMAALGCHVVIAELRPTRRQFMWAAVLDAGYPAALGSHTSLELLVSSRLQRKRNKYICMRRERGIVIGRANVLRATALEIRVEPRPIVDDLLAIGVPQVVRSQLGDGPTGF